MTEDYSSLIYRRQFLLARSPVEGLSGWNRQRIGELFLHTHPDLEVTRSSQSIATIMLIGYLYDAVDYEKTNAEILSDIVGQSTSFSTFLSTLKSYAGRYVFLYHDGSNCKLVHDALALREVYYCTEHNLVVCGSQPNLVAEFSEPKIQTTGDAAIHRFYTKDLTHCRWVGDETYYADVKHLLPNHGLDLKKLAAFRYWPDRRIEPVTLEDAVNRSCAFLQGMLRAVTHRHSVMLAVTAGTDSRTMLAASRGVADKIYFFINKERDLSDQSPDISVPREILAKLGLPFHVHSVPSDVDLAFKNVFLRNTFFASERILPTIYNVYFGDHSSKVNILGIGEIGRTRYGKQPKHLTGYRMAYALGYKHSEYAVQVCNKILPEMLSVGKEFNINVMTLLYWEQTMGNWGTTGNSESDIAIEEFDPYDSHLLYEILLGVDATYSKYGNNILFREMIQKMWPELSEWPINPPSATIKSKAAFLLKKARVYPVLKAAKYHVCHARYRFTARD